MPGAPPGAEHVVARRAGVAAIVAIIGGVVGGQPPETVTVDPLQQAVVDSLAFPPRTTPGALLEAVILATDVEAFDVARVYLDRLVAVIDAAGEARVDQLADLGAAFEASRLARLERSLRGHTPEIAQVVAAIRAADGSRRRDPARLGRAAADLGSADAATRVRAASTLADAGLDALTSLVEIMRDPAAVAARPGARRLLRELGPAARDPLLAWLGSPDAERWDGVIAALDATEAEDVEDFLLAPALVADTPPPIKAAAVAALDRRTKASDTASRPSPHEAIDRLARRLDRVLSLDGLPEIDHLMLQPVTDPAEVATAFGGTLTGTVERFVWNPDTARIEKRSVPPRLARAIEAEHVARDIVALSPDDPQVVRLVLLARLEAMLAFSSAAGARARPPVDATRAALSGPEGFDADTTSAIMEMAIDRGMWDAAAAAADALAPSSPAPANGPIALPRATRTALVRALAIPDATLQFAAARTLALAGGEELYAGSSLAVKALIHAAASRGEDRVVVAHPDRVVAEELATAVSRFGYDPVVARTGREAVFAARDPDTVLVLLGARCISPGVMETIQYLQQPPFGAAPPVLVVVDPLDDDGRGRFLQKRLLALADVHGAMLVDRLDSMFMPTVDEHTGAPRSAPRFHDAVAQVAGPAAVDPPTRSAARAERLSRAREALATLAVLGERGRDVSGAVDAALRAIDRAESAPAAAAVLGTIGHPAAQYALFRVTARSSPPADAAVVTALRSHAARHGVLLDAGTVDAACARYTGSTSEAERSAPAAALEAIGVPSRNLAPPSVDAAPARSTR